MTTTIASDRLELVSMSPAFIESILAETRPDTALDIPTDWPDAHDRHFLELRLRQLRDRPELEPWFVYAVVLPKRRMIGRVSGRTRTRRRKRAKPASCAAGSLLR